MKPLIFVLFSILCSGQGILKPILGTPAPASGEPIFTHIQGGQGAEVTSGTTVTLTAHTGWTTPTAGNAVLCRVSIYSNSLTISDMRDANNNIFTVTPGSPSNATSTAVQVFMAYRFYDGGDTPSATITATASSAISFVSVLMCDEFHRSSGAWSFDTDAVGHESVGEGVVDRPSITPAVTGELLYQGADSEGTATITTITSPFSPAGGFTGIDRHGAGYVLASSGTPSASMTLSTTATWNSMVMAIK